MGGKAPNGDDDLIRLIAAQEGEGISEGRRMSEQLADTEFEMELAPYNNYTGGTPVANAKFEGVQPEAGVFATRGQYARKGMTEEELDRPQNKFWFRKYRDKHGNLDWDPYRQASIKGIPDTVQAFAGGATNKVWQHEFTHRNNPDRSEAGVRNTDALIAPNEAAWDDAVIMKQDMLNRRRKRGSKLYGKDAAQRELLGELKDIHLGRGDYKSASLRDGIPKGLAAQVYKEEIARGGSVPESMRTKNSILPYSDNDHLRDYSKMRQAQTYWPKVLKEIEGRDAYDAWKKELQHDADADEVAEITRAGLRREQ